ncbi:MAG: M50 family metallopeptidase [Armatimonadetes bacterium]|nr:M50 family metallopeptidase [Armatimonadota bacterium]
MQTSIDWMAFGQTSLALIIIIGALIFFHELGHFAAAKLFRIRVEEFAFGFGPKFIRIFKRGETEYTIHPIPLGGFVKLAGMEPGKEDIPGGFNSKPVGQRMLVYFSGPLMSFVLAYLIFCMLGVVIGLPTGIINKVDLVAPGSEAERIGLKTGDLIVSINGEKIDSGMEMLKIIHGSPNKRLTLVIQRDGELLTKVGTPQPQMQEGGKKIGILGFLPAPVLKRVSIGESVVYGTKTTKVFLTNILASIFSREIADSVGGPISIADAARTGVERGLNGLLQLTAVLSLSLGIINLLPIPVLDGGHLMLLLVEAIRGKRISQATMELAIRIGITTIAIIFLLIMYLDLNRLASNKLFR